MSDIVSIGSLTLDLYFQDKSLTIKKDRFHLALGGKYVVNYFNQGIGGGGGNVAVGLSRAKIKTGLWAETGSGGVGNLIIAKLKDEGVNTDFLEIKPELTNVSAILLSEKGERTIINHRSHQSDLKFDQEHRQMISKAKAVFLGNMPEMPLALREEILTYAKLHQLKTILNLGVNDCRRRLGKLRKLLNLVDYFIVNRYELSDILDVSPNELMPNAINYQRRVLDNPEAVLIITDGQFGSYAHTLDQIIYQKAYKVTKIVDATGAGDAFTSGFISGVFYHEGLPKALQAGAKNAASVISKINAQDGLLRLSELFD